jgi:pimeloyl-ACP methyl ester carboxylesterase
MTTSRLRRWTLRVLGALVIVAALLVAIPLLWLGPPRVDAATDTATPPPPAIDTAPGSTKPTLIVLHGAGLNAQMWRPVIRHLDPRWRVLAIDLPGHGARADGRYTRAASNRAIAAAAASVAPAPVILVGDSLGGYAALNAASALPRGQLRGLVVAGATEEFPPRLTLDDWGKRIVLRWLIALKDREELSAAALARYGVAPADRGAILAAGVHLHAVEVAVDALIGSHARATLATIPQPVLIVNGDGDLGRVAGEPVFLRAAQHATSVRYDDTFHGVSLLRPRRFADDIDTFAERVFAPAPASGTTTP